MNVNARHPLFAWLQLMRLPNVFTAVADVAMGYLVTHRNLEPPAHFALLAVASCLLYLSGMVLNDVFDADVDAREQPHRPIPSGRISIRAATAVGWAMLTGGALIAWFASLVTSDWRPGAVATMLAACIFLYNRVLKHTLIAPLAMGACRSLNILLGMSLAQPDGLAASAASITWASSAAWILASGIGVYVTGVTIFARTDAHTSARGRLILGLSVLLAGMTLLAVTPIWTNNQPPLVVVRNGWYLLWALLATITARRCIAAIFEPTPQRVQTAVRHCVQTIIVLDAAVCVGYAGPLWGFAVLALIFPTVFLAGWLRAT
jgi:4-hydroxybenzoate polyprenyltransferase